MTLYDFWISLLQAWLSTLTFCKNHPTVPGLVYLIFRQNSIRKAINHRLPKQFRDTVDADILEIKDDLKLIKKHFGVIGEWQSNGKVSGLKLHPLSFSRLFLFLRKVIPLGSLLRRKNMLTNLLKANLSKKLISALVAIGVTALNQKFNLNLSENEVSLILGLSLVHISLQTVIDSIKAYVSGKTTSTAQAILQHAEANPLMTFEEALPIIRSVHTDVNNFYQAAKSGSGMSQAAIMFYQNIAQEINKFKDPAPLEDKL